MKVLDPTSQTMVDNPPQVFSLPTSAFMSLPNYDYVNNKSLNLPVVDTESGAPIPKSNFYVGDYQKYIVWIVVIVLIWFLFFRK